MSPSVIRESPLSAARPSRRAVARGAAWAVPTIAVGAAAPLAAASACPPQPYTIDWRRVNGTTYTRTSATSGTATTDPDGAGPVLPVTLTISSAFTGQVQASGEKGGAPANLDVTTFGVGGTASYGLSLHQEITTPRTQTQPQRSARQTLTFTFSRPVTNLSFVLADIDSAVDDFVDRIELSGGPTVAPATAFVVGNGTQGSPLRPASANRPVANTSNEGSATVTYAGPLTSFTMVYWNATTTRDRNVDPDQVVFVGPMSFTVVRQGC